MVQAQREVGTPPVSAADWRGVRLETGASATSLGRNVAETFGESMNLGRMEPAIGVAPPELQNVGLEAELSKVFRTVSLVVRTRLLCCSYHSVLQLQGARDLTVGHRLQNR